MGRFGLCYGPFWLYDGPFWTMQWAVLDIFLEIKIFGAVLVGAVLAMGRFGIGWPLMKAAKAKNVDIHRKHTSTVVINFSLTSAGRGQRQ